MKTASISYAKAHLSALPDRVRAGHSIVITDRLAALSDRWTEVLAGEALRSTAERILRTHPLRAADATQLAAALVASDDQPGTLPFVSLDARQRDAARREGFSVEQPAGLPGSRRVRERVRQRGAPKTGR